MTTMEEQRCPVCGHDVIEYQPATEMLNSADEPITVTHRCGAHFWGVLLNEVSPGQFQTQTYRLTNHYSICVLPFSLKNHADDPFAAMSRSSLWSQRIFSRDSEDDVDRTEYFLPYIRKFLFPSMFHDENSATEEQQVLETCRHYRFDLSQLGELNEQGELEFQLSGRDTRKRLAFNHDLVLESAKLTMFNYGSGFLILRFSSRVPTSLFDQMTALQFLRPYAPLYTGFELPTLQIGEAQTRIPELLSFLLQDFSTGKKVTRLDQIEEAESDRASLPVKPIYDDRMMVDTYSCLDQLTAPNQIEQAENLLKRASVVNVDTEMSARVGLGDAETIKEWMRLRWEGFSKNGGAIIVFNTDRYNEHYLGQYHASYYFDIFLIAALQRVTLLTLFERLSDISGLTRNNRESHQLLRKVRYDLLRFRNQCCFSQITNRERGQLLARKWGEVFENHALMSEVNDQSEQLELYLKNRLHEQFEKLIRLGGFLATAVPAILGMDVLFKGASWVENVKWLALVFLLIGTGVYAWLVLYRSREDV